MVSFGCPHTAVGPAIVNPLVGTVTTAPSGKPLLLADFVRKPKRPAPLHSTWLECKPHMYVLSGSCRKFRPMLPQPRLLVFPPVCGPCTKHGNLARLTAQKANAVSAKRSAMIATQGKAVDSVVFSPLRGCAADPKKEMKIVWS